MEQDSPSKPSYAGPYHHEDNATLAASSRPFLLPTSPSTKTIHTLDNTGYCLLSLDGGGVRGLSILFILQSIMRRLNFERRAAGLPPKKPCEIFDLIGGTSTGGLIAIMLGRLEMTVEECIAEYTKLMRHVFSKRENRSIVSVFGKMQPRFSAKALEEAITGVLESRGVKRDEMFEVESPLAGGNMRVGGRCKVFVCTKFRSTNTITRLRTYTLPSASARSITITQAALATSAAPTYFSAAKLGASEFVDGALGANNPAIEVEEEARDIWCEMDGNLKPLVKCFISIGTGHPGIRGVDGDRKRGKGGSLMGLAETLVKEATETEPTTQRWLGRWRLHVHEGRAFRFNVRHGLEGVRLAEFEEQGKIEETTATYLEEQGTKVDVRRCVENLRLKEYEATPDFARKLNEQSLSSAGQKAIRATERATPAEIAELIASGKALLSKPPKSITRRDIQRALSHFSTALHYSSNDPTTTAKQVARICQKLMETSLMLSIALRDPAEQKAACDQAYSYGKTSLDNVLNCGDECMAAQVEFLLACAGCWKTVLQVKASGRDDSEWALERKNRVRAHIGEKLETLRRFPNLDMVGYEVQAAKYETHLDSV